MSKTTLTGWALLLILTLVLAAPAAAQRVTGQISGTVKDDSGSVLPGVTISVSGENIIGTKTTVTNANGYYRVIGLPPGSYDGTYSLDGFATQKLSAIRVSLGATTVENVQLSVAEIDEVITVVAEVPVVDTESNEVGANYDRVWVENAPMQRQSFNDLVAAAPGSLRGGDDSRRTMVYGSSYDENSFQLDGADVNDNFFNEQLAQPNIDAIEEIEVLSLGAPAEYGNLTGAVYNIVTRQGTNQFHGDINAFFQDDGLTGRNTSEAEDGGRPFTRDSYEDYTFQIGGPVKQDKVWFFASYQNQEDGSSEVGVDPAIGTATDEFDRYFGKLNVQLNPSHSLQITYHQDSSTTPSALSPDEAPSTRFVREGDTPTPGIGYTGVMSDRTLVDARFTGFYGDVFLGPVSGPLQQARFYNLDTGFISGGHYYFYDLTPTRTTLNAKVSHLADDFLGSGDHDFRFGVQLNQSEAGGLYGYNDLIFTYQDGGQTYGYGYTRVPFSYSGNAEGIGAFVDDTWRVNDRLTLNLGLRIDSNKAFSEQQSELDANGNPTGVTFPEVEHYTWDYISPRFGLNYQVTQDARTVLKIHAGRYHRAITTGEFANVIGPSIKPIFFGDFDAASGQLINLVQISDNSNLSVDPGYDSPRTDQFIVSLERQLTNEIGISLNLVKKRGRDFGAWQDFGGVYQDVTIIDDFGSSPTGQPITLRQLQNSRDDLSFVITNRDEMDTDIEAASLNLVRRFSGRWSLNASVTWLQSEGRTTDSLGGPSLQQRGGLQFRSFGRDPNDFVNTDGRLRGDTPLQLKAQLIYQLPKGWLAAVNLAHREGANRVRRVRTNASNLNSLILLQERGTFGRLPSATFLDARIQKDFRLTNGYEIGILIDAFNLLDEDAHEGVLSSLVSSGSFDLPDDFVRPRRFQIGARFRF